MKKSWLGNIWRKLLKIPIGHSNNEVKNHFSSLIYLEFLTKKSKFWPIIEILTKFFSSPKHPRHQYHKAWIYCCRMDREVPWDPIDPLKGAETFALLKEFRDRENLFKFWKLCENFELQLFGDFLRFARLKNYKKNMKKIIRFYLIS